MSDTPERTDPFQNVPTHVLLEAFLSRCSHAVVSLRLDQIKADENAEPRDYYHRVTKGDNAVCHLLAGLVQADQIAYIGGEIGRPFAPGATTDVTDAAPSTILT